MRLKDVAILNPKYDGEDLDNELVSFSPMECLRYDSLRPYTIPFKDARGKYTYFANNDVLFAKVTPCFENLNTAIASNLLNGIGFGSSEINVLRFSDKCYTRYFFYLICSRQFIDKGCASMSGVGGLKRVNPLAITTFEFELPSRFEQEAIADYLDKECYKITREIDLLERKVDCYSRLRRSIINRTVTRGIDPAIPLKSSGLRWLPYIPIHWEINRIRNFFNYRNEKVSEIDFAPLSVTKDGVIPQMENVAKSLAGGDTRKKVCKYDFVVNSRSDRKGSCGTSPFEGSVSSIYIVLEPRNISPNFANYYFRCNDWIEEFYRNGKGIVADLWTTNYATMRNIEIAIPPIKEQQKIAIYLDEKCAKIDALIGKTELKIERLKELKRSLINEVVTGQRTIKTSDL